MPLKIILCTINSETVYNMAYFLSRLFPNGEYHLVSVIYPLRARALYNKYYDREVMETISKAQDTVEYILRRSGVSKVVSSILTGKPSTSIVRYAMEKNADLIAITPRAKEECRRMGGTTRAVIEKSVKPVFLFSSHSLSLITEPLKILVVDTMLPQGIVEHILNEIALKHVVEAKPTSLREIENRITYYDLIVISREYYKAITEEKICRELWASLLIVPVERGGRR